jgi:hypothetical protein
VAQLILHDVEWFAERGHPVLVLGVVDRPNAYLTVALSTSDAQALALTPTCEGLERLRLFGLVEGLLGRLNARLEEVEFAVGPSRQLQATLRLGTAGGEVTPPANFADVVALACRAAAPMTMTDAELTRAVAPSPAHTAAGRTEPAGPIRAFVETLDLDWIDGRGTAPDGDR